MTDNRAPLDTIGASYDLKARVAAARGVPTQLLAGATEAELNASADALLAYKAGTPAPARTPEPPKTFDELVLRNRQATSVEAAGHRSRTVILPAESPAAAAFDAELRSQSRSRTFTDTPDNLFGR